MSDHKEMTKKQLVALLETRGVAVPQGKPNHATLLALVLESNPSEEPAAQPEETPAPATPEPVVADATDRHTGGGLKIEKDRPEQNGIKRPSAGGKCREVWDALDGLQAGKTDAVTSKEVRALADARGWNSNNASIEFYQWRKYNGVTGRQKPATVAAA